MFKKNFSIKVYYDNWCPVCINVTNRIKSLDWLGLIELIPIRDEEKVKEINIPIQELAIRMHAIKKKNNKVLKGIDAISAMIARLPLLFPFWFILKFFTLIGVGHVAYDFIATRRKIIPVGNCKDNVCKINQ
ncbi:thiol-disulfide oxidoreductase DCC family protein [Bacillus thuringiensis]|uniref:thiol-disulfide oxidoreductase DCC family protein n=1 Tax=Bacillus thuringiensis TaxID=1428 RepID=UPI000BFE9BE2|nr:DUF393 domain-containing protein [Bacillus thuringiensis]PGH92601.1 hypothetical protein CN898_26470 [Bacillus thuringiensis]